MNKNQQNLKEDEMFRPTYGLLQIQKNILEYIHAINYFYTIKTKLPITKLYHYFLPKHFSYIQFIFNKIFQNFVSIIYS